MTREVHKYYLRGYQVISNYHLNFPHTLVDFDELFTYAERQEEMNNVVIALDEIHILLDSRSGMSNRNKITSFWFNQSRKMGWKLFYTTQYSHQVDRRLRAGTDFTVLCSGHHILKDGVDNFVCDNQMVIGDEVKRDLFVGNRYFSLYNTKQVIKFMINNGSGGRLED